MTSSHNNQNGIKLIMTLMIIGVVAIVAIGGWLIWLQFNNNDEGYVKSTSAVVLEPPVLDSDTKLKLPEGWAVEVSDETNMLISNAATNCSVSTTLSKDDTAKMSEAATFTASMTKALAKDLEESGYIVKELPAESVMIDAGVTAQSYPTYEISVTPGEAGDDLPPSRESIAYVVGNGQYAEVRATCDNVDYAQVDKDAIKNVIIPGLRLNIPAQDPEDF